MLPRDVAEDTALHTKFPQLADEFKAADGVYVEVLELFTKFAKVVAETPELRDKLVWVLDADGLPRRLHWIFAIGPDGWPYMSTRPEGATSAPVECLNLLLTGQLKELSLELFAIFAKEDGEMVRALMELAEEGMRALELGQGVDIEMDLTGWGDFPPGKRLHRNTFAFRCALASAHALETETPPPRLKCDQKYWGQAWGTSGPSSEFPMGFYDFRRGSQVPLTEHEARAAVNRVGHDERLAQWTASMAKKKELDDTGLATSTKRAKLLEWARGFKHSMVNLKPLWLGRTGCYDGAVHLPSNLVGWVVEELYEKAKQMSEVATRLDATATGSAMQNLILFCKTHGIKPVAKAFETRLDPQASKTDPRREFRLTSDQRNKLFQVRHARNLPAHPARARG